MKKRLEYRDEKTQKFWEGNVEGRSYTIRYGKIGTNGHESTSEFATEEEAVQKFEKVVKEKLKKGYQEVQ
jgi:predicted DNA-binding WGR domain protein